MSYILSAPGTTNPTITLTVAGKAGALALTALQDVTVNAATELFTWTQLDTIGKYTVPTTSSNSLATNIVVDPDLFFGQAVDGTLRVAGSAGQLGLIGLSDGKVQCSFTINMGAKSITGTGYVTGLSPTVSADSPVWVTPVTVSVTGDYTWA